MNLFNKTFAALELIGLLSLEVHKDIPPYPDRLQARISQELIIKNNNLDKYAVLVKGDNQKIYNQNFSSIYNVLIENGFKSENIYVFVHDGGNSVKQFNHPVDDVSSKESLEMILNHLAKKIDKNDIFLLYLSDHGGRESVKSPYENQIVEVSRFFLRGGDINELELEKALKPIYAKNKILAFDFCYDGGFADRLGKNNDIAVSSSLYNRVSHAPNLDSFNVYFFQAFRDICDSDYNNDKRVSIDEAYRYAIENYSLAKKGVDRPQLVSKIDVRNISLR
ncbi:MAG: C13 family peptidase [Nanoarchaeota archaeon]|nr:C13 family peptidase [Nanoarchaeota archaeon]